MYILDKNELKRHFKSYDNLADELYEGPGSFSKNKPEYKILDEGVYICPDSVALRLKSKKKYSKCCYDLTDLLLNMIMLGNRKTTHPQRIIIALMLKSLISKNPKDSWTIDEVKQNIWSIIEDEDITFQRQSIEASLNDTIYFHCFEVGDENRYSLKIGALAQMTRNVKS